MGAIRLVTNPTSDTEFQRRAQELAVGTTTPDQLERLLREQYSSVKVVQGVTDIVERWYVYREGRWINSRDH